MTDAIIKQNTRILTPREYLELRKELNPTYQIICDVLLNTGMRVEEFWEFVEHPKWYKPSRRCISLPLGSIKKVRCLNKERDVLLTDAGCHAVETMQSVRLRKITRPSMWEALRRAADRTIGKEGVTSKMFRKTWVSWLLKTYPERQIPISLSMGHDTETMKMHYLGIAFEKSDADEMKEYCKGWG